MHRILVAGGAGVLLAAGALVACFGSPAVDGHEREEAGTGGGDADGTASNDDGGGGPTPGPTDGGDAGAACDGPCPSELLVDAGGAIDAIAVDDVNIYFTATANGDPTKVYACPKTGCVGTPLLLGESGTVDGLVALGGRVYWANQETFTIESSARTGGGKSTTFAGDAGSSFQNDFHGVWTDGTLLYVATANKIRSCSPTSCSPTVVTSVNTAVGVDVACAPGKLAFSGYSPDQVEACSLPGCTGRTVLGSAGSGLSLFGNVATWSDRAGHAVYSCGTAGCANAPTKIATSEEPLETTSDGVHVYFRDTTYSKEAIYRCPVAGCSGAPEKIAEDSSGTTTNLVLDGAYLYWGTGFDLRRLRVKP